MPFLANQPRHRWGGIGHPEGGAEGTGEGIAEARGEGLELLPQLVGGRGFQKGNRAGGLALVAGCGRSLGADLPLGLARVVSS